MLWLSCRYFVFNFIINRFASLIQLPLTGFGKQQTTAYIFLMKMILNEWTTHSNKTNPIQHIEFRKSFWINDNVHIHIGIDSFHCIVTVHHTHYNPLTPHIVVHPSIHAKLWTWNILGNFSICICIWCSVLRISIFYIYFLQ